MTNLDYHRVVQHITIEASIHYITCKTIPCNNIHKETVSLTAILPRILRILVSN